MPEAKEAVSLNDDQEQRIRVKKIASLYLKPYVKRIDAEGYYPETYIRTLGSEELFRFDGMDATEALRLGSSLIEITSRMCMTTGFTLWCHLAALTFLRHCDSDYLRNKLLPQLEQGIVLGGTGLSNPMKFYAGLDKLNLLAKRQSDGFTVSGTLPMVSNLGDDHWFGIVFDNGEGGRAMAFVPCTLEGLTRKEQVGYLGLNGSATYACRFDNAHVPTEWIVSEHADQFVERIRPTFLLYQISLGLGIIAGNDRIHSRRPKQTKWEKRCPAG